MIWDDFCHKLNDQVGVPIATYLSQFPEIRVHILIIHLRTYNSQMNRHIYIYNSGKNKHHLLILSKMTT